MNEDGNDDLQLRLDALKQTEQQAKPASTEPDDSPDTSDTLERDQLILQAAELRSQAADITVTMRRFAAQQNEIDQQQQAQLKAINTKAVQLMRQDVGKLQAEQEKAFRYWAERLEEVTATNRFLAKGLLLLTVLFFALMTWEVLR